MRMHSARCACALATRSPVPTTPVQVKAQALIFHTLRAEMPKMTGKDRKQRELIAGLEDVFLKVAA